MSTDEKIKAALAADFPIHKGIADQRGKSGTRSLGFILGDMADNKDLKQVQQSIRKGLEQGEDIKPLKAELPNVNYFLRSLWVRGEFILSGVLAYDFDHIDDRAAFVEAMRSIGALAVKPSATDGYHVIFLADTPTTVFTSKEQAEEVFHPLWESFKTLIESSTQYNVDAVCKNVNRAFYISGYRAELFSDTAKVFDAELLKQSKAVRPTASHKNKANSASTAKGKAITPKQSESALNRKLEDFLEMVEFRKNLTPDPGTWRSCLWEFAASCAGGYVPMDEAREWARERFEFVPDATTTERGFKKIFVDAYASREAKDAKKEAQAQDSITERLSPDKYRVRTSDEIEPPTPVLTAPDDEIIVSLCNLVILLGKAKTKKTFLTTLLVADYIESRDSLEVGEILFFDTEQGSSHTQKIANRIKALCGGTLDEDGFQLYALRELMPRDRADFIEQECRRWMPRLVVIDGIVDICQNFLDLEKSTETVQQLMTLSGELKCAILGVLHENKGKDDRNGRGHLGTIATQKAETVMNLSVDERYKDLVTVEFTYTRNKPPQPFTFAIDDDGLPYISTHALPKIPKDYDLWKSRLPEPKGYADLRRAVMADTGKTQTTAENHIRKGVESGVIELIGNKYQLVEIRA